LPRIAYNAFVGVQQTSRKAWLAVHGGSVTWAAKPRVKESPNPARILRSKNPANSSTLPAYSHYYEVASSKVP